MEVSKKYVVYELNRIMGSEQHLSLQKVQFSDWVSEFNSEGDAIAALIKDEKKHEDYLIIPQVYLIK